MRVRGRGPIEGLYWITDHGVCDKTHLPTKRDADMKVTIEIPDDLLMEARHRANREGVTLSALVETGLRAALDERRRASAVSPP